MRLTKQEIWARAGKPSKPFNRDAKYLRKAKKKLFGNRRTRPCAYCGKKLTMQTATRDHITAQSKGGKNRGNIALACYGCNQKKRSMPVEKFRELMKR